MNDSQFHQLADQLMDRIEEIIDNFNGNSDIDCEKQGNVMTLTFDNCSKIVINRQEPLHQIWLASRNFGFHFNYHQDGHWYCDRSQKRIDDVLSDACLQYTGETIRFEF